MDKKKLNLAVAILKSTTHYACGNVLYEVRNNDLVVYSNPKYASTGAFNSPKLASAFEAYSCYCQYNKDNGRVELVIF